MTETSQFLTPDTTLFGDIFNASPIGIAVENLEGQPLFVNRAFCAFLGFSEKELRSKHCVDFSPPEDAEKDWELFQQLRAGSIDHYHLEKRYFRKDGSLVWGSLSISLLNSRPSSLVLAMVQDITEKKTAEEARFRHAAVIVLFECGVLAVNGGRCPLTDLAARYTIDRASNFDIYLPNWLGEHNKVVFGVLFVAGELVVVGYWLRERLHEKLGMNKLL